MGKQCNTNLLAIYSAYLLGSIYHWIHLCGWVR